MPVSVVIIAKNEASCIVRCVQSALQLSADVIVVDTGSSDDTAALASGAGARLVHSEWLGFGPTRNFGAEQAVNNWILSVDADEEITAALAVEIQQLPLNNPAMAYRIRRQNFFRQKKIRFGEWKNDTVLRLYNRTQTRWNSDAVHETLELNPVTVVDLQQVLHHYTVKDLADFTRKNLRYAELSAQKYAAAGKKASAFKIYGSPLFGFLKGYVFQLGFLDGREGFYIAKVNAFYTFMKYALLRDRA